MNVLLGLSLGVNELAWAILSLGVGENCHLEAAGDTGVSEKLVHELTSTEGLLDLLDKSNGVAAVASAATVLNLHEVGSVGISLDLVWAWTWMHI